MHGDNLWYVFVAAFVLTALLETFLPFRQFASSTRRRWTSNLVLFAVSSVVVALAFQVSAVVLSISVRNASHGLLNRWSLPYFAQFLIAFAFLDLTSYGLHRTFHAFGFLWRVHEVHHAESDLDLTTGFRFHPLESLASQGVLLLTILLLGPPPVAVIFGTMATVLEDFFQHANLRFPEPLDRILRTVIVTPAMHRVHHLEQVPLRNKNFGTIFSFWDRIFGTYAVQESSEEACFGLEEVKNGSELNAALLLLLPFRRAAARFESFKFTRQLSE
jgi:sterol desaturase/sphingolipid hydroxylase (fatty acid hydroxylase superfamily)